MTLRKCCQTTTVWPHHPTCGEQTDEEKLKTWRGLQSKALACDRNWDWWRREIERRSMWEGKYAIVKRENNALRRKIHKLRHELGAETKGKPCQ